MVWLYGRRLWKLLEQSNGNTVKAEGLLGADSEVTPGKGLFLEEGDPASKAETSTLCTCHMWSHVHE